MACPVRENLRALGGRRGRRATLGRPDFFVAPPRAVGVATHDVRRIVVARRGG